MNRLQLVALLTINTSDSYQTLVSNNNNASNRYRAAAVTASHVYRDVTRKKFKDHGG